MQPDALFSNIVRNTKYQKLCLQHSIPSPFESFYNDLFAYKTARFYELFLGVKIGSTLKFANTILTYPDFQEKISSFFIFKYAT